MSPVMLNMPDQYAQVSNIYGLTATGVGTIKPTSMYRRPDIGINQDRDSHLFRDIGSNLLKVKAGRRDIGRNKIKNKDSKAFQYEIIRIH
jgi:hypothetical protein